MKEIIKTFLPSRIFRAINSIDDGFLEEIHIRKERQAYVIQNGQNKYIDIIASTEEMIHILTEISKHSLYAFRDTIANGYISLDNGIRIGLIGRASVENGQIVGIYDINEFAIRLPNHLVIDCGNLVKIAQNSSILIYSPPGVGKTTLLRNLIVKLSKDYNGKRIGVVDTRGELSFGLENKSLLVSLFSGYPRKIGIEIAVRTMNSQILVCDEIGDETDASAIIDAQGAGVPIIATCHGKSVSEIFSHTGIRNLHKARIFNYYIGIQRNSNFGFNYTITSWEEAENDNW